MTTDNAPDLLPPDILFEATVDRKTLVPVWIRIFSWIFLVLGVVAPFSLLFAALGYNFALSLYGLESSGPFTLTGISIVVLFTLKGVVAFGLINHKDWAVQLAIVDAIVGIALCIFIMLYPPFIGGQFNLRLELFLLVPYLIKMNTIKAEWERSTNQEA